MPQSQLKFVILDRDGVINRDSDQFIKTPDEWMPIEGSLEAIAMLNQAGYRVVVASNQSGIGRGLFEMSALNAMHEKMYKALATSAAASKPSSSARTRPPTTATAASPNPACTSRLASASASSCAPCPRWAIRCATSGGRGGWLHPAPGAHGQGHENAGKRRPARWHARA
jgi:hypothetical protein